MENSLTTKRDHSLWSDFEEAFYPFFMRPALPENKTFLQRTPYNVHETDEFYQLSLDVPGVDPKQIQLKVQENTLFVSAKEDKESKSIKSCRSISTSFSLPHHVDISKIEANVENGVMDIVLPKKKEAQLKEISVQSTSSFGFLEKMKKQLTSKKH